MSSTTSGICNSLSPARGSVYPASREARLALPCFRISRLKRSRRGFPTASRAPIGFPQGLRSHQVLILDHCPYAFRQGKSLVSLVVGKQHEWRVALRAYGIVGSTEQLSYLVAECNATVSRYGKQHHDGVMDVMVFLL